MEKLAKVLKAVVICHDLNRKCSECPYHRDDCVVFSSRLLQDAAELYTELLSGSLARRIVEEAQTDGTSADKPVKHLTYEDVDDCIFLLDEIRSILVSGQYHGDDSDDEPEDQVSFTNDRRW